MDTIGQLKQDLILASAMLEWDIGDIWGHVSARLPDGKGFLLKHLRHQVKDINRPDEVLTFDYDGNLLSGSKGVPKEIVIYTTLYRTRPEINGIVHAHPPMAITVTATNQKIVPIHLHSFVFKDAVPVYPIPIMICTDQEGKAIDKKMGSHSAVVIKGHGAVTIGADHKDATIQMLYLERTARMIAAAKNGKIKPIPAKYVKIQEQRLARNIGDSDHQFRLEWEYFTRKLKKNEPWTRG
ncbi:MAG TPA: class II aldolase/adducin family protein [Candidatus Binatia bacterium]